MLAITCVWRLHTLVGASWHVVAGDQKGVDFIPMKYSTHHSYTFFYTFFYTA